MKYFFLFLKAKYMHYPNCAKHKIDILDQTLHLRKCEIFSFRALFLKSNSIVNVCMNISITFFFLTLRCKSGFLFLLFILKVWLWLITAGWLRLVTNQVCRKRFFHASVLCTFLANSCLIDDTGLKRRSRCSSATTSTLHLCTSWKNGQSLWAWEQSWQLMEGQ